LAALLLALAVASGPLFVSSAASSALTDELEDATRFGAGAAVVYEAPSTLLHPEEAEHRRASRTRLRSRFLSFGTEVG
jgi:hypothetical protein